MAKRFGRQQKRALKAEIDRQRAICSEVMKKNERLQSEKLGLQVALKAGEEKLSYADTLFQNIADILGQDSAYLPPNLRKTMAIEDMHTVIRLLDLPILQSHVKKLKNRVTIELVCGREKRVAIAYSLDAIASRPLDIFTREVLSGLASQLHNDLQRELN